MPFKIELGTKQYYLSYISEDYLRLIHSFKNQNSFKCKISIVIDIKLMCIKWFLYSCSNEMIWWQSKNGTDQPEQNWAGWAKCETI